MKQSSKNDPRSLRLYRKVAIDRARRELGDAQVRTRWTREVVDPFDTPLATRREPF